MASSGSQEHATPPTEGSTDQAPRHGSIFHRRTSSNSSGRGFFRRRSSSPASPELEKGRRSSRGFLWWHPHEEDIQEDAPEDPRLVAAREQLARAERAEIRADREVVRAAGTVAEARQNLRNLEREIKG